MILLTEQISPAPFSTGYWLTKQTKCLCGFKNVTGFYSLDVEEHVGLLVENHRDVTGGHGVVVHLVPLAVAALQENDAEKLWGSECFDAFPIVCGLHLNVTDVMSSVTGISRVDQHSVQAVDLRFSLGLRHEGSQVQVVEISDTLRTANRDFIYYLLKRHSRSGCHHRVNTSRAPSVSCVR